jgi:hypothetical protein
MEMETRFKSLFDRFYYIQCEKYFELTGRGVFNSADEEKIILNTIRDGWNKYIESKKEKLLTMNNRDIGNLFEAIDLEFPRYKYDVQEGPDIDEEETFDGDEVEDLDDFFEDTTGEEDDDKDFDNVMEMLGEELNKLSDELEAIPEEEREDVIMLMLAFPALVEIGFPVDVFMSGDGSTHLTDKQRQQIDWARQLAYKIVEMVEEENINEKNRKNEEITRFASVFVPKSKINKVVMEIREAYERGRRTGY